MTSHQKRLVQHAAEFVTEQLCGDLTDVSLPDDETTVSVEVRISWPEGLRPDIREFRLFTVLPSHVIGEREAL